MSDYTPSIQELARAYEVIFVDARRPEARAEAARAIAAHDAVKRAEWEAEQGDRRPCRLPHTAPPCTTCRCGARETWDAATRRAALAEQGETEYVVSDGDGNLWALTSDLDDARHYASQEPGAVIETRTCTPWLPVPDTTERGE